MQIYIHRNNRQLGPFTEIEIMAQFNTHAISLQDQVWWEGLPSWMPLEKSPLMAILTQGATSIPAYSIQTSQWAIWSLVCGCLSLACGIFTSIPAVIFGHISLAEIKRNPSLQGRGMALAGMIIGYFMLVLDIIFIFTFISFGQIKDAFKTFNAQLNATQTQSSQENANTNQNTNSPDQSTNSPDSATNSPDSSTNSTPTITP